MVSNPGRPDKQCVGIDDMGQDARMQTIIVRPQQEANEEKEAKQQIKREKRIWNQILHNNEY